MKKLAILFLGLGFIQGIHAQYDPDAKIILDAMSKKYRNAGAFRAEFSQKLTNESAKLDESISGKIIVKGSKYKLEVAGQQIFNDGKDVWTYNQDAKEVTVSTYEPEEQEISLSNIWDIYKEGFKYILMAENENGNSVIDLEPVDRKKSYFKIRMIVSKSYELKGFTVFETSGNKYLYTISSFTPDSTISDTFFTFNTSRFPDVEVIDFRG